MSSNRKSLPLSDRDLHLERRPITGTQCALPPPDTALTTLGCSCLLSLLTN